MARFSTLISLWQRRVEAQRRELGRTLAAIEAAEADIAACAAERRAAAPADPRWRPQFEDFCRWSLQREAAHRHNLAAFRQRAEAQRAALAEAMRHERSFVLLQEREDARLARRERRREEATLVEHALRRWREVRA